jgi:hypothetical protein
LGSGKRCAAAREVRGQAVHVSQLIPASGRSSWSAADRSASSSGDLQKEPPGGVFVEPADHTLGRSRGGLTSKIHLVVEQGQKPLSVVITAGQRGDSLQFDAVLTVNARHPIKRSNYKL